MKVGDISIVIEKLRPEKGEVAVISFNYNDITVDQALSLFDKASNALPENAIIVVPDCVSLRMTDKEGLKSIVNNIEEIIESIEVELSIKE